MTDPSPTKTSPVRMSLKRGPVAEGVVEEGTLETAGGSAGAGTNKVEAGGARPAGTSAPTSAPANAARPVSTSSGAPRDKAMAPRPSAAAGPRRVRLSVSRVDPWSVMKLAFLLSVALGIMTVIAAAVAWNVVDSMGVFTDLESLLTDLGAIEQFSVIMEYLRLKNIMSMAVVVSIVNVALITALATLGAFLYNIVAALVGGLHVTLTDD